MLENVNFDVALDWEWQMGWFVMVLPTAEADDDAEVTSIMETGTQVVKPLPNGFRMRVGDVGDPWRIADNHDAMSAELQCQSTGAKLQLWRLFDMQGLDLR